MKIIENLIGAGVYKISHPDTHKIYIGSALNIKDRAKSHKLMINYNNHHSKNFNNFIKKVDKSLFVFEVIKNITNDIEKQLVEREQYFLDTLLKAKENNADFFKLGLNGNRVATRNKGTNYEKPILQYDLDGNFIREWKSGITASKTLKISYTAIIQNTLNKLLSAGGFVWKTFTENYPLLIDKYKNPHLKPVLMYNKIGIFLEKFSSIDDCSRKTKINQTAIRNSIKKDIITKNYRFKYYNENFSLNIGKHNYYLSKNIHVYLKQNLELIGIYDSFAEVQRITKIAGITISKNLNSTKWGYCKYIFTDKPLTNEFLKNLKTTKNE